MVLAVQGWKHYQGILKSRFDRGIAFSRHTTHTAPVHRALLLLETEPANFPCNTQGHGCSLVTKKNHIVLGQLWGQLETNYPPMLTKRKLILCLPQANNSTQIFLLTGWSSVQSQSGAKSAQNGVSWGFSRLFEAKGALWGFSTLECSTDSVAYECLWAPWDGESPRTSSSTQTFWLSL